MTLLDSSLIAHGRTVFDRSIQAASLDHALWFHRPFRADEWLLYAQDSPNASGASGFSRGLIFDRAGTLVASVAQEGLIRDRARREAAIARSLGRYASIMRRQFIADRPAAWAVRRCPKFGRLASRWATTRRRSPRGRRFLFRRTGPRWHEP